MCQICSPVLKALLRKCIVYEDWAVIFIESNEDKTHNVNEDAGRTCGKYVLTCVWTVNTALGLCALNSVGGPSEGRSPGFFKWDLGRCQTCKEWFVAFGGGFIFLLISSLFKYQEQFYFNPLPLTAS